MINNYIQIKRKVLEILKTQDVPDIINSLKNFPPTKFISFLIGAFLHPEETIRWKAIITFGYFTAEIAKQDMERARIIIRRLMWMLNEESGGMPWGVLEGFAEALYNSKKLKDEYLSIFVSYIWDPEDKTKYKADNYLEFPPAQRGVIWGISRLAQKYKEDLFKRNAHIYVYKHLFGSEDYMVKFLSFWALNQMYPLPENFKIDYERIKQVYKSLLQENIGYFMFDGKEISYKTLNDFDIPILDI